MTMSYNYASTPLEEWQDFVLWDEDCYSSATANRCSTHLVYLGTDVSGTESPYATSAPPSNYDGPSSYDYNVSAPPSIIGESSSYGQFYGTSPTISSTATSPLVGRDDGRYFGSFGACDKFLSPLRETNESPLIDTTRERIIDSTSSLAMTAGQVFTPHLAISNQAFSGRDMVASQILTSNTGTWAEPSFVDESIAEGDENSSSILTAPIPIIRAQTMSLNGSFDSYDPLRHSLDNRTRAITIPQPSGTRSAGAARSRFAPPMLSTSPVQRRPRSSTLSRSSSRAEYRKNRTSPSPTSAQSFGFVTMQMDSQSGRMAASTTPEGPHTRVAKGRKKSLDPKQRSDAALMRIIGSCSNCKKRKEKCDPGTPCKSCLKHYKGDLVNNPCRNHALAHLSEAFLSSKHGWHPTNRTLQDCMRTDKLTISTDITYKIPLHFGFGLPMSLEVHPVLLNNQQSCVHEHLVYSWPPSSSPPATLPQPVLPALLTSSMLSSLEQSINVHLEHLVMSEFKAFPPYCSPFRILHRTYVFFRSLTKGSEPAHLLLQALKLLVLVHVGGDITLPKQSENDSLRQLVRCTMNVPEHYQPSPCLIRAQFGAIMPLLAGKLMKEVLSTLERILLSRNGDHWPIALATLIVVLMTVESIHYHAAKLPYHHAYDDDSPSTPVGSFGAGESAVDTILSLYKECFSACHTRLQPNWKGDPHTNTGQSTSTDHFIKSVREALAKDGVESYLGGKASEKRFEEEDMEFFFDRLVARLLLPDS
ncbi:uncharacterized protein M421DRAFT_419300 [Didymella exigua CBS 183.55]|uniref:Zn(2)-C6 fungal-type domain-containing protein n=1 Tax=Didymella exigua CBS 183.55 TaxID=1150837 RepID=A0A6A5RR47_9PLEO|nr:uncharacterized protein M421DRAFT_419300 [Didymella exigua CBS 183.55]KAF1929514.1 hypothetical protein M421DRAFT_419300 [Didymella exigua CBS 183.55]